jgi:hypothetical protein
MSFWPMARDSLAMRTSGNHVNLTGRRFIHVTSSTNFDHLPNIADIQCTPTNDGHDTLRSFAHDRHEGCLAALHSTTLGPSNQRRWLSLPARLDATN